MHEHPRPNLHFIWVGPLGWCDPWNDPTKPRGLRLHYLLWRYAAVAAAKRLMAMELIHIVHHVSWNSISAPPLLWRTGKPFVWGPIGGGQVLPWRFLTSVGCAAVPELFRNLRVGMMPWDTEPAPYRRADRSAAGSKRRERRRAAPGSARDT